MVKENDKGHPGKHFCISCGKDISIIEDSVIFKCPSCGEDIARCGKCRIRGVEYTCKSCGFVGP
ncbi:MAG: zinc finger domain-containing protein [Candidatus Parvarchaeota archaeon]|nr:zinc finger domain-containing protein [Candidatus Parvarchaeota archaeon]